MNRIFIYIRLVSGAVATGVVYIFGGIDKMFIALLLLMVFDYITGIMCALVKKTLSSKVGYKGICRKLCVLIIIALSNLGAETVNLPALRSAAIGFYIANEAISILENAGELGVAYPKWLKEALIQLKNKEEITNNK